MAKLSFKIKNVDSQQYLIHELAEGSVVDEDVLGMLEEESLEGMLTVGVLEGDTTDCFCYDVTNKEPIADYFKEVIDHDSLLTILHNIVHTLVELRENAIPMNYVVLHKGYIYVNRETLDLEFICIPIELDDSVTIDLAGFVRGIVASLMFKADEDGDYVAKLITYVNDKNEFTIRGLVNLIDSMLLDEEEDSDDIIADYEELESYEIPDNSVQDVVMDQAKMAREAREDLEKKMAVEAQKLAKQAHEQADKALEDDFQFIETDNATEDKEASEQQPVPGIMDDDMEEPDFEKLFSDKDETPSASPFRMNSGIKINRAQVIQNTTNDVETTEVMSDRPISAEAEEEEEVVSDSILGQAIPQSVVEEIDMGGASIKPTPYLIRVNTEERIMIPKQTFKIGKASIGMDYRISGNSAVSRNHATIYVKDGVYYVKDNKSTNHTYINGIILDDAIDQMLTHDATVTFGDEEFIFKLR